MTTHEEESRRGGFRGAVDELFGRGERTEGDVDRDRRDEHVPDEHVRDEHVRDERAEGVHRDDAYVDDPTLDDAPVVNEPGTQSQSQSQSGGQQPGVQGETPHGDEVRGDTVAPDQVQRGGDPTAQGQLQHGGEVRGDTDLPAQGHFDDAQQGGVGGVRDDTAPVTERPSGYADEGQVPATDPAVDRASAGQTATEHAPVDDYPKDAVSDPAAAQHHDAVAGAGTSAGASAGTSADMAAAHDTDDEGRAALVTSDRAESYSSRWNSVKGDFVDEPRRAVANADALVGELLDELQELFKAQRANIEQGLDADETSTEDLRLALRRYRSFFDRLLSI